LRMLHQAVGSFFMILTALLGAGAQTAASQVKSWAQTDSLAASDGAKNDELGYSIAISGNVIVVGAPYASIHGRESQGAAYVFVKDGEAGHFKQVAKLTASDGAINYTLGSAVAISDGTIVVGADSTNLGRKQYAGAAYVYCKPKAGWSDMTEAAKLTAGDAASQAYFGSSIAISGDTVVVGADGADIGANRFQGAAYVFVKPSSGWKSMTQTAKLTASDGAGKDQLGYSAAMSGDTIVVGARAAAVSGHARQGAVYVFQKPGSGWKDGSQTAKLTVPNESAASLLGSSVSVDADAVLAGAPGSGNAYMFAKSSDSWVNMNAPTAKLTAADRPAGDQFGYSVSIHGEIAAVGAKFSEIDGHSQQGAVYVFSKGTNGWDSATQVGKLVADDGGPRGWLGASINTDGKRIVAGAPGTAMGPQLYRGKVYAFQVKPEHKDQ